MFQVDAPNSNGNTPLHIACLNGQDIVISELMSYGASVNATNKKGMVSFSLISLFDVRYSTFNEHKNC